MPGPGGFGRPPSGVLLPPGLKIAGLGTRMRAWVIDGFIFGTFHVAFWLVAGVTGAITVNPAAEAEMQATPFASPTVTPYLTNLTLLAVLMVGFTLLNVIYAAVCWARFRGLPGHRMLSIDVADKATGRNLGGGRALTRSVFVIGIPTAAGAALIWTVLAMVASVPWSDIQNPQEGGPAAAWSGILMAEMILAASWPFLILISTAASPVKQGLHDRVAKSLVVVRDMAAWAAPMPWTGQAPWPGQSPWTGQAPQSGQSPWPGSGPQPGIVPTGFQDRPVEQSPAELPGELPPDQSTWGAAPRPSDTGSTGSAGSAGSAWPAAQADSTSPATTTSVTIGRRLGAYLLDCLLTFTVYAVLGVVAVSVAGPAVKTLDERTGILIGLGAGVLQLAYFVVGWALLRGTVGQRIMHVRVTDATSGKAVGWMDSIARWAMMQGPFALVTIVPGNASEYVMTGAAAWTLYLLYSTITHPDQRGLHDRFVNSKVTLEP
jgi:hypothetical protein